MLNKVFGEGQFVIIGPFLGKLGDHPNSNRRPDAT
jgi:hypothetical protein